VNEQNFSKQNLDDVQKAVKLSTALEGYPTHILVKLDWAFFVALSFSLLSISFLVCVD
jgi:hypothetical protein